MKALFFLTNGYVQCINHFSQSVKDVQIEAWCLDFNLGSSILATQAIQLPALNTMFEMVLQCKGI